MYIDNIENNYIEESISKLKSKYKLKASISSIAFTVKLGHTLGNVWVPLLEIKEIYICFY